jgi:hypothetical protein
MEVLYRHHFKNMLYCGMHPCSETLDLARMSVIN